MSAAQYENPFYKTENMLPSEEAECAHRVISDDKGRCAMTAWRVYPGIELVYNDAHIQSVSLEENREASDRIIEILHCREGRMEFHIRDSFCYLAAGDLAIVEGSSAAGPRYFPLGHYHGITVRIDLDKTPRCLSCLMEDVKVQPGSIAEKFCAAHGGFITRAKSSVEHIFSELYRVPREIQKGYFKLKTLELFLYLSSLDIRQDELAGRAYSKNQAELAKKVSAFLLANMDNRITLQRLAEHFHVSEAHIKKTFKGVYGVSIGAYIRARKMESASYMLEYTDRSVLEIASEHGYDNGSKFASAFRSVKGMNPTQYRNAAANK